MSFRETETLFPALIFSRAPYRRRISESSQYAALRSSFARRTNVGALRRSLAASLDGLFPVFVMQTLGEASWRDPIKAAREPTRTDERTKSRRRERTGEEKQPSQPAKHLWFFCFFSPYSEAFSLFLYMRRLFSIPSPFLSSHIYMHARAFSSLVCSRNHSARECLSRTFLTSHLLPRSNEREAGRGE